MAIWSIEETESLRDKFVVPADVQWRVYPLSTPDDIQLELRHKGATVLVAPTQGAIDSACSNIAFRDQPHRGYDPS